MSTSPEEHYHDWLRDAHAMEEQAESMLKAQSKRLEHYPKLKARIDQHIQETFDQQNLLTSAFLGLAVARPA